MPRPLKWGVELEDTKISLPKDLKKKARDDGINFSDFFTVKLFEYYNVYYQSMIREGYEKDIKKYSKKD